jgi:hypothetical protein
MNARIVSAPMAAVVTGNGKTAHHWHAVEIVDDEPARVLCGRAKPEHILADAHMYDASPVSCPVCLMRVKK